MKYRIFEHNDVKKFFKKHDDDKKLLLRIGKKYYDILDNPYRSDFVKLHSNKCPKCHRARVGDYRIVFYINDEDSMIEIVDIFHRKDDYIYY